MAIEDVFSITGRGTVATGRVERGVVKVGDSVEIVGANVPARKKLSIRDAYFFIQKKGGEYS